MTRAPRESTDGRNRVADFLDQLAALSRDSGTPDNLTLRADVQDCLLDSITDVFRVTRGEIENDTKPTDSPIGADGQGWDICLHDYSRNIRGRRAAYAGYAHKQRYAQETLTKEFADIVDYLATQLATQISGAR